MEILSGEQMENVKPEGNMHSTVFSCIVESFS